MSNFDSAAGSFDSQVDAMQAVVDMAARGVRFGKSRLKAHNRIMMGGHGVTIAYAKRKQKRVRHQQVIAMKRRARRSIGVAA